MMGRYRYRGKVDLGKLPVGTQANRPHQTPITIIQSAGLATVSE